MTNVGQIKWEMKEVIELKIFESDIPGVRSFRMCLRPCPVDPLLRICIGFASVPRICMSFPSGCIFVRGGLVARDNEDEMHHREG